MSETENTSVVTTEKSSYAVLKIGSHQYKVSEGSEIEVDRIDGEVGDEITLENILLKSDGDNTEVGSPFVKSAKVVAKIAGHKRGKKIIVFKKKRRKGYKKKQGHRQNLTTLSISKI